MRGVSLTAAGLATRERIIENAETLFRKYGPMKTAVADIAHLSGMSPANVYKFFSSKDDLIEVVGERLFARLRGDITKITQSYSALADLANARSGAVGPYLTWIDEERAAWPAIAARRYTGPWDRPTANPLLLVNTTADPATPYSSAVSMEHTFANARLLTVAGYGHVLG